MKILMMIPYLTSIYGGTIKVVRELSEALGSRGLQVDIVTTNADGAGKLDVPLQQWLNQPQYRVMYFPCWHRNDLIISPSLLQWLLNHATQYDVVHTHTVFSPLILVSQWICQRQTIPYLATPHGMLELWALAYKSWKKRPYYLLFEKAALHKASVIQAISAMEVENIQRLNLSTPCRLVPNGIHASEFQVRTSPDRFYQAFPATYGKSLILFLGRIDPKKGLDLLATAFASVLTQFPQAHLVIAGPDSIGFLQTAQQYFQQAKCLAAVTFTGMLTGTVKQAAFAAASIYVAPSYSEGFSMSVLEGMASGLPCVITTGCNFPEAAQANAAHVVAPTSEAIASALIDCLSHPAKAHQMGERARHLILQHYTWERSAEQLSQIYTSLAPQQGGRKGEG